MVGAGCCWGVQLHLLLMTCQLEHWQAAHPRARLCCGSILGMKACVQAQRPSSSEAGAFSCAGGDGYLAYRQAAP